MLEVLSCAHYRSKCDAQLTVKRAKPLKLLGAGLSHVDETPRMSNLQSCLTLTKARWKKGSKSSLGWDTLMN